MLAIYLIVTFQNHKSEVFNVNYGVTQGSILCALLFITYVNDIYNISAMLCTDDTSVLSMQTYRLTYL